MFCLVVILRVDNFVVIFLSLCFFLFFFVIDKYIYVSIKVYDFVNYMYFINQNVYKVYVIILIFCKLLNRG